MEITVENLSLKIKNHIILKNINLSLPKGKLIMLLGENGAGKTQLIKIIMGFRRPFSGRICYNNTDINHIKIKERAKLVSYVPQNDESKVRYKVWEFISMGTMPHLGMYSQINETLTTFVNKTIETLGLENICHKFTDEISGGELRLSYLARAIVQNTPWMILDEPTASLDFGKQHSFLKLLKETSVNENKGTLMSIHDPSLACKYADIIILMKNGGILDIVDINKREYNRLEKGLRLLYGENIFLEDIKDEKVLIWKGM